MQKENTTKANEFETHSQQNSEKQPISFAYQPIYIVEKQEIHVDA